MPHRIVGYLSLTMATVAAWLAQIEVELSGGPLTIANVHLMIMLMIMMLIELMSGAVLADRLGYRWTKMEWKKAIIDDFLSFGLVGIAIVLDYGVQHLPNSVGFALNRDLLGLNLVTKFCIVALLLAEGRDAYRNIARARGKGIGPLDYVFRMNERDEREWMDRHGYGPKPNRREVDRNPLEVVQDISTRPLRDLSKGGDDGSK